MSQSQRKRTMSQPANNSQPAKRTRTIPRNVTTVRGIAEKALKIATAASRGIEKKAIDFNGSTAVGTTATQLHFTAISQGTTQLQRVGNQCYVTGMAINYYWYKHPSSVVTNIRFVVFMDTQTVSDVTGIPYTECLASTSILAMINRSTQLGRFKILHDSNAILDASHVGEVHKKIYLPVNKNVNYNGQANSDIQKNAIYGLVLSDDNTNQPAFNYYARVYFHDS